MITCSKCGVDNDADAVFCSACNHFLAWAAPARRRNRRTAPPEAAPEPQPVPRAAETAAPEVARPTPPVEAAPSAASTPSQSAESEPTRRPARQPAGSARAIPDVVAEALRSVDSGIELVGRRGRPDLAEQLAAARRRLTERLVPVAVVGEFKIGKSTLVNALLQTAVCPVDADLVTVVPTLIRYGDRPTATAYLEAVEDGSDAHVGEPVALDAIADYVSETGNPANRRKLHSVEIRLPHLLLQTGLCLVDTPGVGGLDSAHGVITLSALALAEGLLFLTDASQELTASELTFLTDAAKRCANAVCVVTKTDLYPEWRRMVELNKAHLHRAGLDMPVIAVSSFLRLRGESDPALLAESGFPQLVDFIAGKVIRPADLAAAAASTRDIDFATRQLEHQLSAEQQVLQHPTQAPAVVAKLDRERIRTQQLAAPDASWQQLLTDGIQDLVAEVEFDLQERLRTVLRDIESIIDEGDPKESWPDVEVWLRRQVVASAVANFDRLAQLADDLVGRVSGAFTIDAQDLQMPGARAPIESLSSVQLAGVATLNNPTGRLASFLLAGRTATILPMMLVGALTPLLGAGLIIAPALALAAGIGQKVIRDERKRQVAFRRQAAKQAARRYVDEVAFLIGKDSKDALRGTQRRLRDTFQGRANVLHQSSQTALRAVRSALELDPADRGARVSQVERATADLVRLRDRIPLAVTG